MSGAVGEIRTRAGNTPALRQAVSADGGRVLSLIGNGSGQFRFVEEANTLEPAANGLAAYWYWQETLRSGVYSSAEDAWNAARQEISWLNPGQIAHGS